MKPSQAHAGDPPLVQILTQIIQLMQQPQHQPTSAGKCLMIPQSHSDATSLTSARNHWASFEIYVVFQMRQGSTSTFPGFKTCSHQHLYILHGTGVNPL